VSALILPRFIASFPPPLRRFHDFKLDTEDANKPLLVCIIITPSVTSGHGTTRTEQSSFPPSEHDEDDNDALAATERALARLGKLISTAGVIIELVLHRVLCSQHISIGAVHIHHAQYPHSQAPWSS
jgi:hypothetical protein